MLFVMLVLFLSIRKIDRVPKEIASRFRNILYSAFFSVLFSAAVIFSFNGITALISYGFYFSSIDVIFVQLYLFSEKCAYPKRKQSVVGFVLLAVALLDSVFFCANVFFQQAFSVYAAQIGGGLFFLCRRHSFFAFHIFAEYLSIVLCLAVLVVASAKQSFFRLKCCSMIFLFSVFAVCTVLELFCDVPFGFSVFCYPLFFPLMYYCPFCVVPKFLLHKTLSCIVGEMGRGIIVFDSTGNCMYVNEFIKRIFGVDETTVCSKPPLSTFFNHIPFKTDAEASDCSEEFEYENAETMHRMRISAFLMQENGCCFGVYYLVEDITKEKKRVYEAEQMRKKDSLTGVYNKEYFMEKVERRLRFDTFTPYYLVVSDIVNFKFVNDLHGRAFGDFILKKCADEIRFIVKDDDIYGRLGNDRFVLLMPKRRFDENAFLDALNHAFAYLNGFSYSLIFHLGMYEITDYSVPVSVMCDRAVLALETIKNDYKTCSAVYDCRIRDEVLKMQQLMNELPLALQYGEIEMYLQPQFTKDGDVSGAEALVRWNHRTRGLIPPSEFIKITEKVDMISDVDKYVWECACRKLAEWKRSGRNDLYISVNISPKDFFILDLHEIFTNLVKKYGISPASLNLEITETAVIMDVGRQNSIIDQLRSDGFSVEIDDFGSGYSSLNMLKDVTVDVLKIDMSFLERSPHDEKSLRIIESIIVLAHELGMSVVTEGVENKEQVAFLSDFGCDLFQGFYFSKPIPVVEFEKRYLDNGLRKTGC